MFTGMLFAQPAERTIIYVGGNATPDEGDQVMLDTLATWVETVKYYLSTEFNAASADTLYTDVDGVIISESINSIHVPNFALRDNYPVPCIAMEGVFDVSSTTTKWPLLLDDGGIWGYGTPADEDIQWRIVDVDNYITSVFEEEDFIYFAETPSRGIPYIHGIDPNHVILATAARSDPGDVEGFDQDEAIACAYIEDPEIVYMNVSNLYFPEATDEFWGIMKRSVQFLLDFVPVGVDRVLAENNADLNVFPNPASDNATIRFNIEGGQGITVNLISVMGGLVGTIHEGISTSGENSIQLNTGNYAPGLYFIELNVNNEVAYKKIVLN